MRKELTILTGQLLLYALFPWIAKPLGPMGVVLGLAIGSFVLAFRMGRLATGKRKLVYPLLAAILFLPTISLYYNQTAWVHGIWYLIIWAVGETVGTFTHS